MAKGKNLGGRPSIYEKDPTQRRQGLLSKKGSELFEQAREAVRLQCRREHRVSDGDVIDYLVEFWNERRHVAGDAVVSTDKQWVK